MNCKVKDCLLQRERRSFAESLPVARFLDGKLMRFTMSYIIDIKEKSRPVVVTGRDFICVRILMPLI